jgi:hypothetical protein
MTKTVFARAEAAACRAVELFEGGPEATCSFFVHADEAAGTLEIKDHIVHIKEDGTSRVTCGSRLVFSTPDPIEAVLEAMSLVIAARTKRVLREFFEFEGLND